MKSIFRKVLLEDLDLWFIHREDLYILQSKFINNQMKMRLRTNIMSQTCFPDLNQAIAEVDIWY